MDRIKIINVLQGKVVNRDKDYAIGLVTTYGVVTVKMQELSKFLAQNHHLAEEFSSSIVDPKNLIGRYIYVKRKDARWNSEGTSEVRPKLF